MRKLKHISLQDKENQRNSSQKSESKSQLAVLSQIPVHIPLQTHFHRTHPLAIQVLLQQSDVFLFHNRYRAIYIHHPEKMEFWQVLMGKEYSALSTNQVRELGKVDDWTDQSNTGRDLE